MAQKLRPQSEMLSGSPQPNFVGYSPAAIIAKRAPTTTDTGYPLGQEWVDKINATVYTLVQITSGSANWVLAGGSAGSAITQLTTDSGTALPVSGNVNLLGTALKISTSASGQTAAITIPDTFSIGSTSGANSGTLQAGSGGLAFAAANGAISANSGTGTVNVSTDATANSINIATGAGAKTLTLGSTNTTSTTNVKSGSGGVVVNTGASFSSTGIYSNTVQPAFRAFKSAATANVTGNGTTYLVICDTIQSQQGTGYSGGTGVFTAPSNGWYVFGGQISLTGISGSTGYLLSLVSSVNVYQGVSGHSQNEAPSGSLNRLNIIGSTVVPMVAGETMSIQVTCFDQGADTIGIFGSAVTLQYTYFWGYRLS